MASGANGFGSQFERVLPASSVANLYPFNYSGKTDPHGFYLGRDKFGSNIIVDFNRRDEDKTNANILILGNSGQGKSYLLKLILTNLLESGMKYIATRDGVEKVDDRFADRPPSQKQKQLIGKLLHDYPDAKELFEYEDYLASPNIGNASEFITMALDSNWDEASSSKIYMQYIATRPRVEKRGGHGLFSDGNHGRL